MVLGGLAVGKLGKILIVEGVNKLRVRIRTASIYLIQPTAKTAEQTV